MRISCIVAYGLIAIALAPAIAEQKATNLTDAIARASATSWTGTWATADMHDNSGKTFTDQALRQIVRISVGGKSVRLKISNRFGTQPLRVEDVHLALRKSGSTIIESSDRQLLFEGKAALNIPAGASVLSDRVAFDAPALAELAISMYLPGTSGAATFHASAHETSYVETGDANSAAQMKDGKTSKSIYFLTGVDIEGRSLRGSVVTLGITRRTIPTVAGLINWLAVLSARTIRLGFSIWASAETGSWSMGRARVRRIVSREMFSINQMSAGSSSPTTQSMILVRDPRRLEKRSSQDCND